MLELQKIHPVIFKLVAKGSITCECVFCVYAERKVNLCRFEAGNQTETLKMKCSHSCKPAATT